jgi:D-alanine-D-alanine ligase
MKSASEQRAGPPSDRKIRVAVLFGGQSDEHDVSLRSAHTVIDALDPDYYEVVKIGITRDGKWMTQGDPLAQLSAASPMFALMQGNEIAPDPEGSLSALALPSLVEGEIDIVFPVLHGPMGEDGTIQGLFELLGVPYVGAGVLGSAVSMDKVAAKMLLAQQGIDQAEWLLVNRNEWQRDPAAVQARIEQELGYPCFVKPANLGSSVGIAKAHDSEELPEAIDAAAFYDRRVVVERGITGRELEMSVLGNDDPIASVAGEIIPGHEFYDYEAKYLDESSRLIIPAELEPETLARMQQIAVDVFRALDLAGMARVDFFLEEGTDRLLVNEVNTIPGFTSISMYPMLWEKSGLPLEGLVKELLRLGIERHGQRRPVRKAAGN